MLHILTPQFKNEEDIMDSSWYLTDPTPHLTLPLHRLGLISCAFNGLHLFGTFNLDTLIDFYNLLVHYMNISLNDRLLIPS